MFLRVKGELGMKQQESPGQAMPPFLAMTKTWEGTLELSADDLMPSRAALKISETMSAQGGDDPSAAAAPQFVTTFELGPAAP